MSYENNLTAFTFEAGSDLSASQYCFVDVAADGQVDVVSSKGAKAAGVLQDKPSAAGRAGMVGVVGITKVKVGAAVTAGAEVISDADGKAIATDAADQYIQGTALETSTAANQLIAVLIKHYQRSA